MFNILLNNAPCRVEWGRKATLVVLTCSSSILKDVASTSIEVTVDLYQSIVNVCMMTRFWDRSIAAD